jgi:homoserine dehydrogenase
MSQRDVINIGLLGFGVVGSGALQILEGERESLANAAGCALEVKRVADIDWQRPRPIQVPPEKRTTDALEVVRDPEISIVIEAIGGVRPALDYVLEAIANGKSVVTSNKEMMAKEGRQVMEAAAAKGVDICFEGAVCGGIPIIRTLKESLAGAGLRRVLGIVNGTTNYILTQMQQHGREFGDALAEAQQKGYAEPDPTSDVEGFDAAYKLAILASIAFNSRVNLESVYHEGITRIGAADMAYAQELGYVIKLLAIGADTEDGLELRVHPTLVPRNHPLASVADVFNAVFIEGDAVGEVMFYGRGAGSLPTGSAVVGDVVDVARNIRNGATGRVPCTCFEQKRAKNIEEVVGKYYLRLQVADRPGVLASIASVFGEESVSIASVVQKKTTGDRAEIVWITHDVKEHAMQKSLQRIRSLPVVVEVSNLIRVLAA